MEFNNSQKNKITQLLNDLNSSNINYVVPRGHQRLPMQTTGGDIDFIIHQRDFKKAVSVCENNEFLANKTDELNELVELGAKAVNNPKAAINRIVDYPRDTLKLIINRVPGNVGSVGRNHVSDWRAYNNGVMIHLRNHLAYESPFWNGEYRIDPIVENQMFENKKKSNNIYVPSAPDELCHLICRGVFDKKGKFPPYYISRCEELFRDMTKEEDERFRELLSHVFFEADELIYEFAGENKYNKMLPALLAYSDY